MSDIKLNVTAIELAVIAAALGKPYESFQPIFDRNGHTKICLLRAEVENVQANLDQVVEQQAQQTCDLVKAEMIKKAKSNLQAKLRRARIFIQSRAPSR